MKLLLNLSSIIHSPNSADAVWHNNSSGGINLFDANLDSALSDTNLQ
jgi:hypothetical protein